MTNDEVALELSILATRLRNHEVSLISVIPELRYLSRQIDAPLADRVFEDSRSVAQMIDRLLQENQIPGQAPAIQCAVVLKSGLTIFEGSLSTTPEGGLRMLTMQADRKAMTELFFDYNAVMAIGVSRPITVRDQTVIVG